MILNFQIVGHRHHAAGIHCQPVGDIFGGLTVGTASQGDPAIFRFDIGAHRIHILVPQQFRADSGRNAGIINFVAKATIEDVDAETLGGAVTHTEISGIADYKFKTEEECLDEVKKLMNKLGAKKKAGFDRIASKPPKKDPQQLYGLFPADGKTYDMLEIIERIVDDSDFDQFKQDYGKTILCGYARIDGWAVGIVANQRKVVKTKKGEKN